MDKAKAFGPATIANLGAGFDILGLAIEGLGDVVEARRTRQAGVRIVAIESPVQLPYDPRENVAGIAATAVLESGNADFGVELSIWKGMGVGTGLGSSAASAAAAARAVNAILATPVSSQDLIEAVILGETAVAGRHGDNAAPAILGGLVLIESLDPVQTRQLPVPAGGQLVIVAPNMELSTKAARGRLPQEVSRLDAVTQAARLGAMVDACHRNDLHGFAANAVDLIAQPSRVSLIPGAGQALEAAREVGALQSFICGSGPTLGALLDGEAEGEAVANAMVAAMAVAGLSSEIYFSRLDNPGARLV